MVCSLEPPYGSTERALKDVASAGRRGRAIGEPPYGSTERALKDRAAGRRGRDLFENHHTALQREH